MKKILLSTVALATLSMAEVSNTEVSGGLNFFYATTDGSESSMFSKDTAAGQVGLNIAITSDLGSGLKGKVEATILDTLGLENNVVNEVWEVGTDSPKWISEAWVEKTMGKTTVKLGRQTVDSPLFMTETWSIAKNTFDGGLAVNTNIENTTLVAGYFGRHNSAGTGYGSVARDKFTTLGTDGAYAAGVVNTSVADTTLQAWYYNVVKNSKSYFLQADTKVSNFDLGVQYGNIKGSNSDASSAFAVKVGTEMNGLALAVSYSSADEDGKSGNIQNLVGTSQSPLYTEAWWNFNNVGAAGSNAVTVTAEYGVKDVADLGLYVTNVSNDMSPDNELTEVTLTATAPVGPFEATIAYINSDYKVNNDAVNEVQAFVSYSF
jgi:hypothetical protein